MCFVLSCSKKKEEREENTIGSSLLENEVVVDTTLTAETYSADALKIMEEHKKGLKTLLPQMILAEVEIYKKSLEEIEKKPATTYSLEETVFAINRERQNAGVGILEKELELNQTYFQLFNELSLLNEKYKNAFIDKEFTDFYDAGPIVLAEEVLLKIDELVKDEKKRIVLEEQENRMENISAAIMIASVFPGVALAKDILKNVTVAAKAIRRGNELRKNATLTTKIANALMNKKMAVAISSTFKNEVKRNKLADISGNISKGKILINSTAVSYTVGDKYLSHEQASEVFKVVENKINGRIGDFSDGILAAHMQRVRDIIKGNSANLSASFAP